MDQLTYHYLLPIIGVLLILLVWIYLYNRNKIDFFKQQNFELEKTLEMERKYWENQQSLTYEMQKTFQNLAHEALLSNNQHFLNIAHANFEQIQNVTKQDIQQKQEAWQQLMNPVQIALKQVDGKIQDLEKERINAYSDLRRQLVDLLGSQKELRTETSSLVKALRSPNTRGQWGEMQLKRVLELAGMIERCDFIQQAHIDGDDKVIRPDVLVKLPGGKYIIIDAKTPLTAYLNSIETIEEERRQQELVIHAKQVKDHIKKLGQKAYYEQFIDMPEFVVMFLPSESIFSAALDVDPILIEIGVKEKVLLATPTTLIALLRAIAYGWKHEAMSNNAKAICLLGQELSKRLQEALGQTEKLGHHLRQTTEVYQKLSNNLSNKIFITAEKLKDYGISNDNEDIVKSIK